MEKISYKPLIEHLGAAHDQYNQIYRDHELRYGAISQRLVFSWVVQVIEPIVSSCATDQAQAGKIFQSFYKSLLQLLGSQLAESYAKEYQQAWSILRKNPDLLRMAPIKVVTGVNSALATIRKYHPAKVAPWIEIMNNSIAKCQTLEEFLSCGRVCAWMCGLSHLRKKALQDISSMRNDLKNAIETYSSLPFNNVATQRWLETQLHFVGTAGGFTGLGGPFKTPPIVARIDDQIVAADNVVACVLFADLFGSVIIGETPFSSSQVASKTSSKPFTDFQSQHGKQVVPFDDLNSAVMTDNTLVFTRASSFFLYIYGWNS